jgi:hypothetical protein
MRRIAPEADIRITCVKNGVRLRCRQVLGKSAAHCQTCRPARELRCLFARRQAGSRKIGAPAIICGPGDIAPNMANEFVRVDELEKWLALLDRIADRRRYEALHAALPLRARSP